MDRERTQRYEALVHPGQGAKDANNMSDEDLMRAREASKRQMEEGYQSMMDKYAQQQQQLSKRPNWVPVRTKNAEAPHELTITHVNQTRDLLRAEGLDAGAAEHQTSVEWLKGHSIDTIKLTLKDLVNKGKVCRPKTGKEGGKLQQHIQFEAIDINEFEYKLNLAISTYTKRIKWLLQGSKKIFGLIKGQRIGVLVDCSDANFGFGRVTGFQDSLLHVLDEQLSKKKSLYLASFGTDVHPVWDNSMDVNCRSEDCIGQAKEWVSSLKPRGGCNLLKALKHIHKQQDVGTVLVILGSVPDQSTDVLCDYVAQMGVGDEKEIFTVSYDCNNSHTVAALKKLAEQSGGNFHCYATASEQPLPGVLSNQEQIYTGTDISTLLNEIQIAQDVINKIRTMRQGLLGSALVTVMNEISSEVAKLPQSRYLPRPPGHDLPLQIDVPQFVPSSSEGWLKDHGLKAKRLDLYQVLAPNAYSFREEFIPVIRKTVQSQVHEKAMAQFTWHDGSVKNIHVDMSQLFEYQKQLGSTVKIYEKRIDWLSSSSRKIFGTVTGNSVMILVDMSMPNANYLAHVQHSLRLLLEQQVANKAYFNIITFGAEIKKWQPTLVKPTGDKLQACWKWILDQQCTGSRNFMGALRAAMENDEEAKHNVEVDGVYVFTSGIPDQPTEVVSAYVEEVCAGRDLQVHCLLFNVDDYDSEGAIPSRYANITKTAEILRTLAHSTNGRFHWFRETGIIESDDISAVSLEIEKALNFSKKCALLVENVKKKYNLEEKFMREMRALQNAPPPRQQPNLPPGTMMKSLPAPKHTALSQQRQRQVESRDSEEAPRALGWRPSSAKKYDDKLVARIRPQSAKDPQQAAKDPMQKVKSSKKSQQAFFYTDNKNNVGAVYRKYPAAKSVRKNIKSTMIPDRDDQLKTRDWLRMYSLNKLKLDLNKLVSGPDCRHISKPVKALNKVVDARTCNIFPTVNVGGTLKHLQLLPNELNDYEDQTEIVLRRYLKRLQWLLSGSRRVFGTVVEKKVVILLDTSGSMDTYMDELKKELASLIWEQLHSHRVQFNMIRFSKECERWRPTMVDSEETACHDAVKWTSSFVSNGNTCTLEALEMAFEEPDLEAIYLLTDGKPDSSTSLVQHEVERLNTDRNIVINTISFNCDDSAANSFLKSLAKNTGGRYHHCHHTFDAHLFAHRLLTEGFVDHEHPALPEFESDDLRRLGNEITQARRYLAQSRSYRAIYDNLRQMNDERGPPSHNCLTVGPSSKTRPQSAKP